MRSLVPTAWMIAPRLVLAVSALGLQFLEVQEGRKFKVYLDTGGVPTVCVGSTSGLSTADVGKVVTPKECSDRLRVDVHMVELELVKCVTNPNTTQEQWDAILSLAFNVGPGKVCRSTLLRKHNAGDFAGAQAEFQRWCYVNGVRNEAIRKRRLREAALYGKRA